MDASLEAAYPNTLLETLGIRQKEATPDLVVLEMDVDEKVHQPMGLLHGGASAVMAETAASLGAWLNCVQDREYTVGVDLNITHLRAKRSGMVTATATPIKKGRSIHVWGVSIVDEDGKDIAVARCTLAIRSWGGEATKEA